MAERGKIFLNVSSLITHARLQMGYSTLKLLYRDKQPAVDYQTWSNSEAGRRVPTPPMLMIMGDVLNIDRETLIMAYCKDKFDDDKSRVVLESIQRRKYFVIDTLIEAKDHDRSRDYVFSAEQVQAMKADARLRLYLLYTYDANLKTTFTRLANFYGVDKSEVSEVVQKLQSLGLVETIGDEVRKNHVHSTLLATEEVFGLRKEMMLKCLALNIKPNSIFSNHNFALTEESFKQFVGMLDIVLAAGIKMDKDDEKHANNQRFEIAIACNRISDGSTNDRTQPGNQ